MLEDMKVSPDPKQIGYYAGVIESLFAIAQLCTAMFWGRLSDHVGRKPVMLIGLMGMAISVISFGLQKTYVGLIIARFVAGMMNGNIAILQSIVAEITDPTNYAEAAALLPLCFAIGSILGPIIGGFLALPAQNFPSIFGECSFLIEYPYFLPCFIGGLLNLAAVVLGLCFLEETLESKRKPRAMVSTQIGTPDYQSLVSNQDHRPAPLVPPTIRSLCTKPILAVLLTFTMIHVQNVAWGAVIPLYAYTDIKNGGLGMSLEQIGFILSVNGFGLIIVQLLFFQPLYHRFGTVRLFKWSIPTFTLTFLCLPFVTFLAQLKSNTPSKSIGYMIVVMAIRSPGVICYVCSNMLINFLSPSPAARGTLNGMMQSCRALAQAVGPIIGSSLFAVSISIGLLGGNLVWIILALISIASQLCSQQIPPSIGSPQAPKPVPDEHEESA